MDFKQVLARKAEREKEREEGAIVETLTAPSNDAIPPDVWQLIQANGKLATERLNELLNSPRFHRFPITAQAKLIDLAQSRAYGRPDPGIKRTVKATINITDATANALAQSASRAHLPEYSRPQIVHSADPERLTISPTNSGDAESDLS